MPFRQPEPHPETAQPQAATARSSPTSRAPDPPPGSQTPTGTPNAQPRPRAGAPGVPKAGERSRPHTPPQRPPRSCAECREHATGQPRPTDNCASSRKHTPPLRGRFRRPSGPSRCREAPSREPLGGPCPPPARPPRDRRPPEPEPPSKDARSAPRPSPNAQEPANPPPCASSARSSLPQASNPHTHNIWTAKPRKNQHLPGESNPNGFGMIAIPGLHLWVVSGAIRSVCAMFTGTFGSGFRIAGTTVTPGLQAMGALGRAAIVPIVLSAAGLGAAIRGISARRIAKGTTPAIGTTISASVWRERSPLESLLLYLSVGREDCPRPDFSRNWAIQGCAGPLFGCVPPHRGPSGGVPGFGRRAIGEVDRSQRGPLSGA